MLYHSAREQTQIRLREAQKSLDIQLTQAVREINALRESQILASRYRHDMRHHLQYLSACIENGQEEQAQAYIAGICEEIEAQKVQRYCENEAANLILSAFVGRAEKEGIGRWRIPAEKTSALKTEFRCRMSRGMASACRVSVPLCSGMVVSTAFRYRTDSLSSGCLFEPEQIVDSVHFLCDSVGGSPFGTESSYSNHKLHNYL